MKRVDCSSSPGAALAAPAGVASERRPRGQPARHLVAVCADPVERRARPHADRVRLEVGQRVDFSGSGRSTNGTLAATQVPRRGRSHKVRFRGLLLARSHSRLVVAGRRGDRRADVTVQTAPPRHTTPFSAPESQVDVTATVGAHRRPRRRRRHRLLAHLAGRQRYRGSRHARQRARSRSPPSIICRRSRCRPASTSPASSTGQDVLAMFASSRTARSLLTKLSGDDDAQQADEDHHDGGDRQAVTTAAVWRRHGGRRLGRRATTEVIRFGARSPTIEPPCSPLLLRSTLGREPRPPPGRRRGGGFRRAVIDAT